MSELTIVTLCHALSNLTHNRCTLVDNFNTCRCIGELISLSKRCFAPSINSFCRSLISFINGGAGAGDYAQ